jgi:hypothetical protein
MGRGRPIKTEKRKRGRPPKKQRAGYKELAQQIGLAREAVIKDAPETNYFVLCNGKPVKNVKELADLMETIEDQVFSFHVTPEKNDFATWVKDIFNDVELAEKLAGVKDKKNMQLVLYKHITHKLW